jgi:hypothetical protein
MTIPDTLAIVSDLPIIMPLTDHCLMIQPPGAKRFALIPWQRDVVAASYRTEISIVEVWEPFR